MKTEDDNAPADPVVDDRTPIQKLMDRIAAHDAEGVAIDEELVTLKLTRRQVHSIKSAQSRIAKEQAELAAMLTGAKA